MLWMKGNAKRGKRVRIELACRRDPRTRPSKTPGLRTKVMQENMTMKMRVKGKTFHIACVGGENDEHMNEDRGIQPSEQRESLPHI